MPIDIQARTTAVNAIADRIQAYKMLQRVQLGEDPLPAANAIEVTVTGTDGNGPFSRTLQEQLATVLAPKGAGIVTDAATLSDGLRGDILPLLGLDPNANPDALQPHEPIADLFAGDPDEVSAWLSGLLQFAVRVNGALG